jgi:hypothetical protein
VPLLDRPLSLTMTTEEPINSAQVHSQPNRGPTARGPRHTVKTVRRYQDMVAWTKVTLALALDPQTRRAGEKQDPLVMVLIIRFICRRGLTGRDDPLDPHTLSQKQFGDDLLGCLSGKVIEKIDHGRPPDRFIHPCTDGASAIANAAG